MFGILELNGQYESRGKGFLVRLGYRNGRPQVSRYFPISEYLGDREKALQAALEYRDQELKKLKEEGAYKLFRGRHEAMSNSNSGLLGVSYHERRRSQNFIEKRWVGAWICPETGKQKNASFSVHKYGDQEALEMAYACRLARQNIYRDR